MPTPTLSPAELLKEQYSEARRILLNLRKDPYIKTVQEDPKNQVIYVKTRRDAVLEFRFKGPITPAK